MTVYDVQRSQNVNTHIIIQSSKILKHTSADEWKWAWTRPSAGFKWACYYKPKNHRRGTHYRTFSAGCTHMV